MIHAVIFDLDGVIIDSEPVHFQIEKQMFEELNISMSIEEHGSFVGTSPPNMWDILIKKYGISNRAEELVKKQHGFYIEYLNGEEIHPIPGVSALIRNLYDNNFKLILASSAYMDVIDIVLTKFNLSHYFSAKVSGTDLAQSKPHPEIFLTAAKMANAEPDACLVIEDSENGITSAKAAGMKCVGFLNPNSGNQNLSAADIVIDSFDELDAEFISTL